MNANFKKKKNTSAKLKQLSTVVYLFKKNIPFLKTSLNTVFKD